MSVFDSAVRSAGDLAGCFEYDDTDGVESATAYFYLYQVDSNGKTGRILAYMHVRSGAWTITENDVGVRWDRNERSVGLFISGTLWAVFDSVTQKQAGGCGRDPQPNLHWDESAN